MRALSIIEAPTSREANTEVDATKGGEVKVTMVDGGVCKRIFLKLPEASLGLFQVN
jgi:hypothetical protein